LTYTELKTDIPKLLAHVDSLENNGGIRLLRHTISLTEHNLGHRVIGTPFYEREPEDKLMVGKLDNWIDILYRVDIYYRTAQKITSISGQVIGETGKDNWKRAVSYFNKVSDILEPWKLEIENESSQRIYLLEEDKINTI
jgi:hypothetical protein